MLISVLLTARVDISDLQNTSQKPLEEWEPDEVKRYHPSRNLIRKDPEVDEIKRRSLVDRDGKPRMPKAPKGYYVDPESIEVGINPITHYAYRHYTLIKIKKRE